MTDDPPEYLLDWLRQGGWSESDGEWSHPGLESPDLEVWEAIEIERGRSSRSCFDTSDAGQLVRICRRCGYEEEVGSWRR